MIATEQGAGGNATANFSHAESTEEITTHNLTDFLIRAVNHHQAGQFAEAERLYRKILEVDPVQPNANHNLGTLALDADQAKASLNYFKVALNADADDPQFWVSYIDALIRANQHDYAREVLIKGLERGLHGEEVNVFVDILARPQALVLPQAEVMQQAPVITINYAAQSNDIVIKQSQLTQDNKYEAAKEETQNIPLKKSTVAQFPKNPQLDKALKLQLAGKLNEARSIYTKLLKFYPKHPLILTGLGSIALQQGNTNEGVALLEESLGLASDQTLALSNLAIGYTYLKRYVLGLESCNKAIKLNPNYAEAYVNRANALRQLGRFDEAIASYEKALSLDSANANNYFNLASLLKRLKRYKEAASNFQQSIKLNPRDVEAHEHYAAISLELKEFNAALKGYTEAIKLNRNNAENYYGRGLANLELKHLEVARNDFERATQLNPSYADAHLNLGAVLHKLGRLDEALAANNTAIELNGSLTRAYNNRGLVLADMMRFDEALVDYNQAIAIDSTFNHAYWNKAVLHLLQGEFAQGWQLYEYRWKTILKEFYRPFKQPLWLGDEPIAEKTLLIYPEQGFGDYIHFCRYAALAEAAGAKVVLETPKALMSLVASLKGNFTIVEQGASLPAFDYHCPIMSLPLAFKTSLDDIPATVPYLFADKGKQQIWQAKLGTKTKPRIGLVWSGSTTHKKDHYRSISLETMKPLFRLPIEFYALQKEIRDSDKDTLAELTQIKTYTEELIDFSDTAALIQNLDLVITIDTSVAHLAASMGKACWVLLPFVPDFRWMLHRSDSPWYPSVTLFRQPALEDWDSVVNEVQHRLEAKIDAMSTS